jgi:hypothetical protein
VPHYPRDEQRAFFGSIKARERPHTERTETKKHMTETNKEIR